MLKKFLLKGRRHISNQLPFKTELKQSHKRSKEQRKLKYMTHLGNPKQRGDGWGLPRLQGEKWFQKLKRKKERKKQGKTTLWSPKFHTQEVWIIFQRLLIEKN